MTALEAVIMVLLWFLIALAFFARVMKKLESKEKANDRRRQEEV
jgi:hypothetical protein